MGMESFNPVPPREQGSDKSDFEKRAEERERAKEQFKAKEAFFLQAVSEAQTVEELKFVARMGAVELPSEGKVLLDEGMGTGANRWVSLEQTLMAIDNIASTGSVGGAEIPYSMLEKAKGFFKGDTGKN